MTCHDTDTCCFGLLYLSSKTLIKWRQCPTQLKSWCKDSVHPVPLLIERLIFCLCKETYHRYSQCQCMSMLIQAERTELSSPCERANGSIWYCESCTSEFWVQSQYCNVFDHCGNFQVETGNVGECERGSKWSAWGEAAAEGSARVQSGGAHVLVWP